MHLDFDNPVPLAGLAAPALNIEAKAARPVSPRLGLWQGGEPFADWREGAGICGRVRARRAPDRALVDVDDLVEIFKPGDRVARGGGLPRTIEPHAGGFEQGFDHQGGFAAAGDAGDTHKPPQREFNMHVP